MFAHWVVRVDSQCPCAPSVPSAGRCTRCSNSNSSTKTYKTHNTSSNKGNKNSTSCYNSHSTGNNSNNSNNTSSGSNNNNSISSNNTSCRNSSNNSNNIFSGSCNRRHTPNNSNNKHSLGCPSPNARWLPRAAITGSIVLQGLWHEEYAGYDVDIFCKPSVMVRLLQHLVTVQGLKFLRAHGSYESRFSHGVAENELPRFVFMPFPLSLAHCPLPLASLKCQGST